MLRAIILCSASELASSSGAVALRVLGNAAPLVGCATHGHASRHFTSESCEEEREVNNPRVLQLAEQIMQLNLLEVSDLTELLRKRLNIPSPSFGVQLGAGSNLGNVADGVRAADSGTPPAAPVQEQTEFAVKLEGYDAAAKIKVIKEVRAITDLGLKEAKELVESSPAMLKKGLKKEDAEQIKAKLEAAGARVMLE